MSTSNAPRARVVHTVVHTGQIIPFPDRAVIHSRAPSIRSDDESDGGGDDDDASWGPGAMPSDPEELRRYQEHAQALSGALRRWGVGAPSRIFARFELAEVAMAVVAVEDQQRAGIRVRNPAGLLLWWLTELTGRRAYPKRT